MGKNLLEHNFRMSYRERQSKMLWKEWQMRRKKENNGFYLVCPIKSML